MGGGDRYPEPGGGEQHHRSAGRGAEALVLGELGDPRAHRLDDPPAAAQGAEADGDVTADRDPVRHVEFARQIAGRIEQDGDDAHRLLGVVEAVPDRIGGGGNEVESPELALGASGARPEGSQLVTSMISIASIMPSERRQDDRDESLVEPGPLHPGQPGMGNARSHQSADERMAGRGRDALQPGHDVPEHRPDQSTEDHRGGDQVLVDQPLADRVGDLVKARHGEGEEVGGEVEEGGEDDRLNRTEKPGRDHRRDRVGGVMESVQEVERQGDGDQPDE